MSSHNCIAQWRVRENLSEERVVFWGDRCSRQLEQPVQRPCGGKICTFVFLTALLRYNAYAIQFTDLKYTIQWLLMYSELCNHQHDQFWNIFTTTKETSYLLANILQSHHPPNPQPLICFPWICLFWALHINGIKYMEYTII